MIIHVQSHTILIIYYYYLQILGIPQRITLPATFPAIKPPMISKPIASRPNLLLCNNAHIHSLQPANCFSHSSPHPCAQPPAKRTLLEISLQITLCLLNPPGRRKPLFSPEPTVTVLIKLTYSKLQ